ncbi:tRNA nucleotidyltransferase/poly(A) polymerase [Rubripirellula reticaptiva]|uniref:tRNA nucleotidyltransferase/poly(A) polymerase n=1 Tax=Rubripirellula reticaptiva TaxID=2528013 RepID=A0A5C6EJK5_9BACT|nr:tRNA nucleotidyltransferase/poly(A) polymerase [Rubripirellula reticaptiva]
MLLAEADYRDNRTHAIHSPSEANQIANVSRKFFHGPESQEAIRIITTLRQAGFVALLAGGCVRDAMLGKQPKDYDVATDATPDAVRDVFGKKSTLAFGASFGVIGVLPQRDTKASTASSTESTIQPTEVATFRSDGEYSDGRRPDSVHFGDAKQDALRRDFTINGLFYDPHTDEVIDYVGGEADLQAERLRTIGNPADRFGEDKLRMLRAVRFATTLGFAIDPSTRDAIESFASQMNVVSGERIGAEMRRVFTSPSVVQGLRHLIDCKLDETVLPEISAVNLDQLAAKTNKLSNRSFAIVMACFLLQTDAPEQALAAIADRWKLSNEEVRQITAAILHYPVIGGADRLAWSVVQPILIDRDAETIIEVAEANSKSSDEAGIAIARRAMAMPRKELDPPPFLNGKDLKDLGIPAGPLYKSILQSIRDAQLDGKIHSRGEAITQAQQLSNSL